MAKSDSSAVQKLIELAQQKPLEIDADLEGLFAQDLPRAMPRATPPARPAMPPPRRSAAMAVPPTPMSPNGPLPPLPRVRAAASTHPGISTGPAKRPSIPSLPQIARASQPYAAQPGPSMAMPVAQPLADAVPASRPSARLGAPSLGIATEPVDLSDLDREDGLPYTQATRRSGSLAPWILAGAFALGVGFSAVYLVSRGIEPAPPRSDQAIAAGVAASVTPTPTPTAPAAVAAPAVSPSAAPATVAAPVAVAAPAAVPSEPVAAAVAPAAAAPASVTVSFVSTPPGASVILVGEGTTTPLGKTPLTASLPTGRTHQVLFTLEGRATVLAQVDPATRAEVVVELGAGSDLTPAPTPSAGLQPAPVATPIVAAPARSAVTPARAPTRAPAARSEAKRVAARERPGGASGTLMLGAKPPCEIIIDGKATGLTTPQREISLTAGNHQITLVNRANQIKKAFGVSITAGNSVKVVKDFTDLMK